MFDSKNDVNNVDFNNDVNDDSNTNMIDDSVDDKVDVESVAHDKMIHDIDDFEDDDKVSVECDGNMN